MKKLLHIIESLGVGGAEKLLVGIINGLDGYEHHLIILNDPDDLRSKIHRDHSFLNLHAKNKIDLVLSIRKVKNYIKKNRIDIVHSHLYNANIISRLAVPNGVSLFNSIHAVSSQAAYQVNKMTLHLERLTYRKRHNIIAVSNEVLKDLEKYIGIKGKAAVLYNFIDERFFAAEPKKIFSTNGLKLVAVGNLRYQKNYPYLLEAFKRLPQSVTLDIYGEGSMRSQLQKDIDENKLPVRLCGLTDDLPALLPAYDAFVMSSFFEGQPLSLLEAMAAGLPAILADIPVLREVAGKDALYFDIDNTNSFCGIIQSVLDGKINLNELATASHKKVNVFAHRDQYLEKLNELYNTEHRN